jgi:hypothetical protein
VVAVSEHLVCDGQESLFLGAVPELAAFAAAARVGEFDDLS